ncbi:MAG TPA: indolepyruvate ferredoxin oxidoreductase family protein [Noviherbaspirillum sp.]|uniref:indolepyruvate ferredoxin oxidoreductase family protein n=1 Tax=Noviherbaspirillum sp. TaxID=1926288 RepID=UPI002B4A6812|nr:indolepyruvate ferredoxin oxidoreductase family protein [Noviherbaspirillum sp.]HJV85273.1 indolepyruvate ferredoxin oxidoreductase family protein [Noviherbaspirillum sp.]
MNAPFPLTARLDTTLDEKYALTDGWAFMSGTQALVRLPMQQRMRDAAAGRNTAGFISGYRGSPLGRYDMELWRNADWLKKHHIHFQPGVNEDLAATAVWGSQYIGVFPGAKYDGVFSIWYGKTPGVDRSGDVLRHANGAGTSPWGGALAVCGDDHAAKSSTQAAQSDYILIATGIPVLYPANVQDILDFGLHGLAMSRHAGCWVGMKLVTDVVESSGSVYVSPDYPRSVTPSAPLPADGLNIRRFDRPLDQEARLYNHKLHAALDYARVNGLNRIVMDCASPRLGIVAAGKGYTDVRQALLELGLTDDEVAAQGIRLLKIGMVWPLDPQIIEQFAQGLDVIVVVEEKRPVLENQIKTILFDTTFGHRIRVVGKFHGANEWSPARGQPGLPSVGELSPPQVGGLIARLLGMGCAAETPGAARRPGPIRMPNFCSGCPHNTSTQVPAGSRALAGIGCHAIAALQRPEHTGTMCHMGGEGAMWVGQAPFTEEKHVFANLGDGTYFHSGFLAIRQAVAAKVPITYKLLVNGFVSMTGGQPVDGDLSVPQMATELLAEGVGRIVVVTEDPGRYAGVTLPAGVKVEHRRELDRVQRELRDFPAVSVLIYDQMCATERRRLRKRGKYPDPDKRTFINTAVCEGCGDCSTKSNCMSIEPVMTELGRKRRINQSSCNKDYSCVEGFCPSFVTVHGGSLRRGKTRSLPVGDFPALPEPAVPQLGDSAYGVLVTGIGGTGVVTIGAILGMAAHIDGKAATTLDVTGLAQKYGAVMSHVRIGRDPEMLQSSRLAAREADLLVGCDLVVSAGDEALSRLCGGRSRAAVNTELTPTSDFTRNPDWQLDAQELQQRIRTAAGGDDRVACLPASRLAMDLMGDTIAANMLMLGYAWQRGWVPVSRTAIERAVELNGVSVDFNLKSFLWGRRMAHDPASVEALVKPAAVISIVPSRLNRLADIIADRVARLTAYQDAAYAERYRRVVTQVAEAERLFDTGERLARAVARNYFKLLAHKDEFEVARLHSSPEFRAELEQSFEGDYKLHFHLGAWPFAERDPVTGRPRKRELGPWVLPVFGVLARLRGLRGTILDPFRSSPERKLAQRLLAEYESDISQMLEGLDARRIELAVEIAEWPEQIRGYGHVREASVAKVDVMRTGWRARWAAATQPEVAA